MEKFDKEEFLSTVDFCLENYNDTCDDIANLFCEKHNFEKLGDSKSNTFWVADERGGILFCGDYYFGMETIITDLKENATDEQLMQYYVYCLQEESETYNYRAWLKLNGRKPKI